MPLYVLRYIKVNHPFFILKTYILHIYVSSLIYIIIIVSRIIN